MNARDVTAIVLAGGRSSRFGRDKLAEPLAGRSLLERAIDAVRPVVGEILVVVAHDASRTVPDDVLLVRDRSAFGGPLVGVLTGLGAASRGAVLVVGGDMPAMVPSVLGAMIDKLDDSSIDAVALEHRETYGPLPAAMRAASATAAAERLVTAGERRLGALLEALAVSTIAEPTWRGLDPEAATLRDIDTPADLRRWGRTHR